MSAYNVCVCGEGVMDLISEEGRMGVGVMCDGVM